MAFLKDFEELLVEGSGVGFLKAFASYFCWLAENSFQVRSLFENSYSRLTGMLSFLASFERRFLTPPYPLCRAAVSTLRSTQFNKIPSEKTPFGLSIVKVSGALFFASHLARTSPGRGLSALKGLWGLVRALRKCG